MPCQMSNIKCHNALRDAIFDTAASAGLAPLKEVRALLPGNDRRPADILIRHCTGVEDRMLLWMLPSPIPLKMTPEQEQKQPLGMLQQ